jgi:hypothetical protein
MASKTPATMLGAVRFFLILNSLPGTLSTLAGTASWMKFERTRQKYFNVLVKSTLPIY